jgi:hypothetical protein
LKIFGKKRIKKPWVGIEQVELISSRCTWGGVRKLGEENRGG